VRRARPVPVHAHTPERAGFSATAAVEGLFARAHTLVGVLLARRGTELAASLQSAASISPLPTNVRSHDPQPPCLRRFGPDSRGTAEASQQLKSSVPLSSVKQASSYDCIYRESARSMLPSVLWAVGAPTCRAFLCSLSRLRGDFVRALFCRG
jgi:hypothetical protein